jgi:hypothetical protein
MAEYIVTSENYQQDLVSAVDALMREDGRSDDERARLARLRAQLIILSNT